MNDMMKNTNVEKMNLVSGRVNAAGCGEDWGTMMMDGDLATMLLWEGYVSCFSDGETWQAV